MNKFATLKIIQTLFVFTDPVSKQTATEASVLKAKKMKELQLENDKCNLVVITNLFVLKYFAPEQQRRQTAH